ncbi:MAG: helix-turn-helix domain-containing protein [Alphaproteobacteria bacterium]
MVMLHSIAHNGEMENLEDIGRNISQLRKSQKLSQEDLSRLAEIDRSYISEIENGHKNPSVMTIIKISRALKVGVDDIIKS